jgi:hypothetical protein
VVAEGAVIVASRYLVDGVINLAPGCPASVQAFAERLPAEVPWRPDAIFLMDVCEAESSLDLLERNSFSSSALYPCDYGAVVAVASDLAVRAWERRSEGGTGPGQLRQRTEPASGVASATGCCQLVVD